MPYLSLNEYADLGELDPADGILRMDLEPMRDVYRLALSVEGGDPSLLMINGEHVLDQDWSKSVFQGVYEGIPITTILLPEFGGGLRIEYPQDNAANAVVGFLRLRRWAPVELMYRVREYFDDPCRNCQLVVRRLIAMVISGGIEDEDFVGVLRILSKFLPEEWLDHLPESQLGKVINRLLSWLGRHDPRRRIARRICEEEGCCPREDDED